MGRGAYLAATRGGTDRAAARAFSDRAQRSYSSQQNNQTGQNNQGTRQSSFDLKSGTSGKDNEIRNADGLTQAEVKQMKALADKRNEAAYQESLKRQAKMRRAIDMAYGTKRLSDENQKAYDEETLRLLEAGVPDVGIGKRSIIDESRSTFHTLTDKQKQFLIDSGFAKAESSGVLGGTMGAEKVSNQLKKDLADATTEEEYNKALQALNNLHGDYKITDQMAEMGLLQHDPSAVYSWSDDIDRYEGGTHLKDAFYDMQSSNLTPEQYTDYMDRISAFGHMGTPPSGGGGYGGYGGYGGGGGSGDGVGGYSFNEYAQQGIAQPPGVGPGTLQEQVSQGFLSGMGAPRFSRGGIVSLLRLGE